ncbi:hypothetical protein DDZ13_10405 [Coraliomargarita sinensis]|uniref:Uncharacterized protein n=1 Tax=Coraliomargarita sinensis TaxID=2174842 RepID=A0A317ZHB2_9BACT|nr:hypothetical protein DDZ13_10405 [Coraliomargarita sinensis]
MFGLRFTFSVGLQGKRYQAEFDKFMIWQNDFLGASLAGDRLCALMDVYCWGRMGDQGYGIFASLDMGMFGNSVSA